MIKQGFSIGDGDWWIMAYYDIKTESDYGQVEEALMASGQKPAYAQKVVNELLWPNTGYTYTKFGEHLTVVLVSHATSYDELYDTVQHELKHVVEHLCSYYGIDPKSERAAYLQGEIARNMYKAVAVAVCPKCGEDSHGSKEY